METNAEPEPTITYSIPRYSCVHILITISTGVDELLSSSTITDAIELSHAREPTPLTISTEMAIETTSVLTQMFPVAPSPTITDAVELPEKYPLKKVCKVQAYVRGRFYRKAFLKFRKTTKRFSLHQSDNFERERVLLKKL